LHEVVPDSGVIHDAAVRLDAARARRDDLRLYPVPYDELLKTTPYVWT
jgi:hypothetical protein